MKRSVLATFCAQLNDAWLSRAKQPTGNEVKDERIQERIQTLNPST